MSSAPSTRGPVVSLVGHSVELVDHTLLSADLFGRMISAERKRSDRSGKGFVLMLVDGGMLLADEKIALDVARTLLSCVRDTDVAGWHAHHQAIGVIFTEIMTDSAEETLHLLRNRIQKALLESLTPHQVAQLGVSFHYYPEDSGSPENGQKNMSVMYPDVKHKQERRKIWYSLKRAIDIAGSLIALTMAAPLFLLTAVAIKLTSPGPVFFRQVRIGQYGAPFTFLKFRSMHVNCDSTIHKQYVRQLIAGRAERMHSGDAKEGVYKLTNDPRITRIGSLIRRTSMDELPQFINVLKGDMSMVGPRPALPYEVEAYDRWHRNRILEVKPGITGLWQVSGRSRVKFDDMVRLDLRYARACSLWLDIKILTLTPLAVVLGEGAY
jgi:lipopolysaccharide/colanic/teichoic acid biosynthesis glycosyltransferase